MPDHCPTLTTLMREALEQAARGELHHAGQWPYPPQTLAALVNRGLLVKTVRPNRKGKTITVWTVTLEGIEALVVVEIVIQEKPVYMARTGVHGDYTTNPAQSARHLMDAGTVFLDTRWTTRARTRHAKAQDPRTTAATLTKRLKAA